MGRINDALYRAEQSRDHTRKMKASVVRLEHVTGSLSGRSQVFSCESILIGRSDHNDVSFDPFEDGTVSAQHAEIRREGNVFTLYDMGSLNGTLVNNTLVRRTQLDDGDMISLGTVGPQLTFHLDKRKLETATNFAPSTSSQEPKIEFHRPHVESISLLETSTKRDSRIGNLFLGAVFIAVLTDVVLTALRMLN